MFYLSYLLLADHSAEYCQRVISNGAQFININSRMSKYQSILSDDDSASREIFQNLIPIQEEKKQMNIIRKNNIKSLLFKNEKENKSGSNNKQVKKAKQGKGERVDRSRSRSREKQASRRTKKQVEQNSGKKSNEERNFIQISDDQLSDEEEIAEYYFVGGEMIPKNSIDMRPYKERRRLDRLFERQQKKYREGKRSDELSCKIFNTIEQYFK